MSRSFNWKELLVDFIKKRQGTTSVKDLSKAAQRRAKKRRAMPQWADRKKIEDVYRQSAMRTAETGILHHVDHIVPLGGKHVSGLHVHYNLRVITADENMKKGNRIYRDLVS